MAASGAGALPPVASIPVSMIGWGVEDGMRIELGRGTSGVVFAAKYAGEHAAVKLVDITESEKDRFLREVNLHYALKHKNVVSVYGACIDARPPRKTLYYIVMERMAASLQETVLRSTGSCHAASVLDRLRWLHHVSKAIRFMHAHNILHGDLKPDNIMLDYGTADADATALPTVSSTAKVTDFGFARIRRGLGSTVTSTAKGKQGSPLYMDPTLWDDSSAVTTASDIYSFGIIAWELLTGQLPYADVLMAAGEYDHMARLRTAVTTAGIRPSLDALQGALARGGVPETHSLAFTDLVARCWSGAPSERPTAEHVEAALDAALLACRGGIHAVPSSRTVSVSVAPVHAAPTAAEAFTIASLAKPFEGKQEAAWKGHKGSVFALALLPDGRLASGALDTSIKVWNIRSVACESTLTGHTNYVNGLFLLPDGKLGSYSRDGTVRVWDVSTGTNEVVRADITGGINSVVALPDGRFAACTGGATAPLSDFSLIMVWRGREAACTYLTGHTGHVHRLLVLPDGRLASCSEDKSIKFWNMETGTCVGTLAEHSRGVRSMLLLSDGRLATGDDHGTLKVWNRKSLTCDATIGTPGGNHVTSMVELTDGRVASGHRTGAILISNISTRKCETRIVARAEWVWSLALLPDGRLVSALHDDIIKVWS